MPITYLLVVGPITTIVLFVAGCFYSSIDAMQ